jgi:acyl-[acyl-carrier-protein]-phospholipid O-acyltransferase/long-chain-fatty-acid--[acyl-carrier-protein] ligase
MISFFRFLFRLLFRFHAYNTDVLKTPGPVLLLPNHISWLDWFYLVVCLDDDWKFVTSSTTAQSSWLHRKIMINSHTFPVENDSPYAVKRMAEYLQKGGRMVLFPEGRLSQTGTLMKLFDGTGFLLHKTNAKVITCYLRGANRFVLSPNPGWKKWFPRVTAHFSNALTPPKLHDVSAAKSRSVLTSWLRAQMVRQQFETEMEFGPATVPAVIVEQAALRPKHIVLEDVTRNPLTYRKLLIAADLLAKKMNVAGAERVGVLLPNVAVTPIVLMSLWCLGKVPAILNFSTGAATMLVCAQLAGLKQIITSKVFVEKAKLNLQPLTEAGIVLIYVEDLKAAISSGGKLKSALRLSLNPKAILQPTTFSSHADGTAVILFTSGSEGMPKGVELTHRNLLANIRQMLATTDLQDGDRIFCSLPLFHSFGLTVGTLLPLVRGMFVFVYPSPLHYRVVPTAFYDTNCTVMLGTNTFLNGYARKAHAYDFRSLRYMFAAAEKLQEATAQVWAQKFGVRILEGYGATECAPCISLNTPLEPQYGSVGKLMPGMEYKIEPIEGVAEGGRLFVRGPNLMKGYLNPDANEKFKALGGWYDTGDIVKVDENGFFTILGRMKRFAKISGEMVSLTAVEDALAGAFPQYGLRCQIAVISQPDADKGERLIAVSNEPKLTLEEIRAAIKGKGLSNLCVPREIKTVREIPKLGTGKVNHRELQKMI